MRISDLARAAGVTVRTLRHYHQIGLLAEPKRDGSNYRLYNARHLIRVLRIKRLSALGFSLSSVSAILGKRGNTAKDALTALDQELDTQIKRLIRQRELIAALGASPGALDTPIELAPFHEVLASAMPEELQETRHEHLLLLAHLAGHEGLSALSDFYKNLTSPRNLSTILALELRFYRLDAESSEETLRRLVDDFVAALGPVMPVSGSPSAIELDRVAISILNDHLLTITNPTQRVLIDRVAKRLKPR
jgi:DNA-binding transcriptional MerR regulator